MKTQSLGVVLMSSLVGCTIAGQDYTEPKITVPATFVGAQANPLMEAASITWWRDLGDPLLNEIVDSGLKQNFDIRIALERIKAAESKASMLGLNSIKTCSKTFICVNNVGVIRSLFRIPDTV